MTVVKESKKLTEEQEKFMAEQWVLMNLVLVKVKRQLLVVQHELTLIIGGPIKKADLAINLINEVTGKIETIPAEGSPSSSISNLSAAQLESKLFDIVEEKRTEIKDIKVVSIAIEDAISNSLTTGSEEISMYVFIDKVITIIDKIIENKVDDDYKKAVE